MPTTDNELLHTIHRELRTLTERIESAFTKDDDDNVDYVGHRMFHRKQQEQEAEYQKSKALVIRNVIAWLAIGAITIIGSALVQVYLIPHAAK